MMSGRTILRRFGACIAPDLAMLQPDLRKRNVEVLLVSYGDAESNRHLAEEHGLQCPILLQEQSEPLEAFRHLGTPVAYLLDEQGRVAQPLAVGADQVPALAQEAASGRKRLPGERALSESWIKRQGLKAGTPARTRRAPHTGVRGLSVDAPATPRWQGGGASID